MTFQEGEVKKKEMEPKIAKKDRHGLWKWTCLKSQRSFRAAETIEELHGGRIISQEEEKGVVLRVKIVVSKQDLRQMVASMSQRNSSAAHHHMATPPPPPSLEQLLHGLRKRHAKAVETTKGYRGDWRPALQSIPEEI